MQGSPNPYRETSLGDEYRPGIGCGLTTTRVSAVESPLRPVQAGDVPRELTGWLEYASVDRTASLGKAPIKSASSWIGAGNDASNCVGSAAIALVDPRCIDAGESLHLRLRVRAGRRRCEDSRRRR
jgi:hypothetical protein